MSPYHSIASWLAAHPLAHGGLIVISVGFAALTSLYIARRIVVQWLNNLVQKTTSSWDDVLRKHGVFEKIAWLAPGLVVYYATVLFAHGAEPLILRLVSAYVFFVFLLIIGSFITSINDIYSATKIAKDVPIKGYLQILKIFLYACGAIVILALLTDRSPWVFLSGIGAATAVLMLVFKDTILSFVASIQIASNDMLRLGDSIQMPKYDADGEVVDIALHTVKVKNWDLTITTVPTSKLIEESFKNWRGMQESGARRIKRAVYIDQTSIRFLDDAMIAKLEKIHFLTIYIREKKQELARYNVEQGIDHSSLVNGRRMTNIGTFRAYLTNYLRGHAQIRQDMTFVVRQLEPGANGLPIEIYVFSSDTAWVSFEGIQADIFDHVLAALPEFGLRVFQNPTGKDLAALAQSVPKS